MADIKLSTVAGSGGGVPKFRSTTSGTIPSGTAAGDILTVNASSGLLVRFKWLVNAAGAESNISIVIDGITVISNRDLTDVSPTASIASGEFGIATQEGTISAINSAGLLTDVTGSQIIIQKSGGVTVNDIQFVYEEIAP